MATDHSHPENIGVINPFALAEARLRQQIDWSNVLLFAPRLSHAARKG